MPEKIMKPTTAPESKGTDTPLEVNKAENEASTRELGTEKGRYFTANMLDRPVTRQDGSWQEYILNPSGPVQEDPLYCEMVRILGLTSDEETGLRTELAQLTKLAAEHTQQDRFDLMGAFIRKLLRSINYGTSNTSKVHSLRRWFLDMKNKAK